jgi:hypothetical protein
MQLKFIWPIIKKKGKSHEDLLGLGSFNFICVIGTLYYQGDTLGELVKCKSSKNSFQSNLPEKSDISGLLTGFQKPLSDMSEPLRIPQSSGLIRVHCRVLVSITGHVQLLDRIYPVITFFAAAKSFC